ncbi:MAG: enhanced serine sensitivity protein SseB C-terminal domain-containing protein [Elusimicrobiota bacterium]|nr:MAG: enhanced serine sensitivity protein SseB C-terminal domain-containing protein [Elusimicrobiota bacterium]
MKPEFYRRLWAAQLHVVSLRDMPEKKAAVIPAGTEVQLQSVEVEGRTYTTFYTSESRLRLANPGPVTSLELSAAAFFNLTRGSRLIMNPGLPFCKEFDPEEIEALLDGRVLGRMESHEVQQDREITIGPPAAPPVEVIGALSRLFRRYPSVRKAYFAQYVDPARDPAPGLIICVDMATPGDWEAVMRDAGVALASVAPMNKFVDIVLFEPGITSVSSYFADHGKPFYERV